MICKVNGLLGVSFDRLIFTNTGAELDAYVQKLGWVVDASTSMITIPPNPDNQIEATVVQENIKLPRMFPPMLLVPHTDSTSCTEVTKIISFAATKA